MNGNVKISKRLLNKLKPDKDILRKLQKQGTLKSKKKLLLFKKGDQFLRI